MGGEGFSSFPTLASREERVAREGAPCEVGDASPMTDTRNMIAETAERLFADHLDTATRVAAEAGTWPEALWQEIANNGLDRVLEPEEAGGFGGDWGDAFVILRAAGKHAAPVPLAETIGASWLLTQAGLDAPQGIVTFAESGTIAILPDGENWCASGALERVPWGNVAIVTLFDASHRGNRFMAQIGSSDVNITADRNIGRDPRDLFQCDDTPVRARRVREDALPVFAVGALVRACQMSGAISEVLNLCVTYAGERVQFGRPIATFQAIQQQLAILAGEAAAADMAAQTACRALDRTGDARFEIASAKIRTGEAAGQACAIAHQVFGAIGFTEEHHLHHLTRRLWSWRAEFGTESVWAQRLGRMVVEQGADALWPGLTGLNASP